MVLRATKPEDEHKALTQIAPLLTSGMQLALAVVAFFFLGFWLDNRFGTSPWYSIGGAVLGVAGGLTKFLRDALSLGKKADEELKGTESGRHEDR